nr:hypothetical protein [Microbacterium bovistercoris]
MDAAPSRSARAVRGVTAALVTALVAATAHTFAGGGAPSPLLVGIAVILAAPLAVALVGRRGSAVRTAAAVAAAQGVFHLAFALFADPGAVTYTAAPGMVGHAAAHTTMTMTTLHGAGSHDMSPGSPMILAHLVAALVTFALLWRGERMLRALGRGIRRLVPLLVIAPWRPEVRRRIGDVLPDIPVLRSRRAPVVAGRGPPLAA